MGAAGDGTIGRHGIREGTVEANGIRFGYLACGDEGPLALCLHGFPDSAHTWRHLLPELAAAGHRAVAPFLRGYAPTGTAPDGSYQPGALVLDAVGLHEALGGDERAVLVGHDWGAVVAQGAAVHAPDRWRSIVTMAVPPGGALGAAFLTDLAQLKRSWYMWLFQLPLAELVVPADDLAFIDMLWRDWSPGHDGAADAARAKACLRDPAHLAAALAYYRAALGAGHRDPALADADAAAAGTPTQPMLYLHGADDGCVGVDVAEAARATVGPNVTIEVIEGCGHFLHLERPDVVDARILEHLS